MNPCLGCKIFMVNRARHWMDEHGFDFMLTGEVLGQRLKSQIKSSMQILVNKTKAGGGLLQSLFAKYLESILII